MKQFKLVLSISALIACVCASGCSKKNSTTSTGTSPGSTGGSTAVQTEPSGPVTMKLNWQVGKVYDEQVSMSQASRIQIPGVPQPMEQTMTMDQGFSVSALNATPDGGKELELKFVSQKIKSRMNTNVILAFDSSKDPSEDGNNPAAPLFRKMMGAHLKYLLDADGKVVKIEGLDEFLSQVSGGNAQSLAIVKSFMSEDTLKQMIAREQGLPKKPVKVGDSWPVDLDVAAGPMGSLHMKMMYTFKGWEEHDGKKCALLDFTGTMSSKPTTNKNGMSLSIDNGELSGKSWFNPEVGMIMETTMDQNMNLKITAQGKTMNSEMKQNVDTKILKISDLK